MFTIRVEVWCHNHGATTLRRMAPVPNEVEYPDQFACTAEGCDNRVSLDLRPTDE